MKHVLPDQLFELPPKARAVHTLAKRIALVGGQLSHTRFEAPWVPYCDNPVSIHREARAHTFPSGATSRPVSVDYLAPCRKCEKCLLLRQMSWRERAILETRRAKRTWFVTLTFSPVHLAGVIYEAQKFPKLNGDAAIDRAAYSHVQRYLKRLRKQRGLKVRYLAVFERGKKTGRAHYHLLVHEVGAQPLRKRALEMKWRSNVHARLVDVGSTGAATYVTKYLTKSLDTKPRASLRYGSVHKMDVPPASLASFWFLQRQEQKTPTPTSPPLVKKFVF